MGVCVGDLDVRQTERLRVELAEILSANCAYPSYFDYRSGRLMVRPVARAKRDEIDQFLRSVNFSPLDRVDVGSPEVRRFFERLFLRYVDVNDALGRPHLKRRLTDIRNRTPRMAAEVQRGLVAHLGGTAPSFGARRQQPSWASYRNASRRDVEEAEHNTRVLEAMILQRDGGSGALPPSLPRQNAGTATPSRPPAPPAAPVPATPRWIVGNTESTIPVPGFGAPAGSLPLTGLDTGGQSSIFSPGSGSITDRPTGPLTAVPVRGLPATPAANGSSAAPGGRTVPRELPPDLYQLYGDYLNDMQPEIAARPTAPPPAPPRSGPIGNGYAPAPGGGYDGAMRSAPAPAPMPNPADAKSDKLIFWQLRYQLEAYVRRAARSYGLEARSDDPAGVLDVLRRSGFVDEADLRIAEGILALTDRVTAAAAPATLEDYRQAFMLYLLYHRSHLA
jgi:hypothetical protein